MRSPGRTRTDIDAAWGRNARMTMPRPPPAAAAWGPRTENGSACEPRASDSTASDASEADAADMARFYTSAERETVVAAHHKTDKNVHGAAQRMGFARRCPLRT